MTSISGPLHPFTETTEVLETFETTYYEDADESNSIDQDTEMTDFDAHQQLENGYEDQDMYNAEIGSTIVEPPQSDVVLTHAPSTIVDEMEYLEEGDYESVEISSKPIDRQPVHEDESYKVLSLYVQVNNKPDTTTAGTPPPTNLSEDHSHPQFFSPASRMIPIQRPATPLLTNLTAQSTEEEQVDDNWPICLYTPTGQEYMLFRSDGDTEALFEDNWLKSQPLETLFSSIRQTLETELASLTTSFTMDEIVLAIPDLDVSIAEVPSPRYLWTCVDE